MGGIFLGYTKSGNAKWMNRFDSGKWKWNTYIEHRSDQYQHALAAGLKQAWRGFKIAKAHYNYDKMEYYALGVNKFCRVLGLPEVDFDVLKDDYYYYKDTDKKISNL